ncbi:MAG: hypothetical protein DCC56_09085 [Anaerolineae bacterium]|nr:MAG: hypothetical protein DCC56_09085 [Anaerolineae bacterium]WKZ45254.1 MAG: hypothetical protein QY302_05640 [Anaerolineales bacterium]
MNSYQDEMTAEYNRQRIIAEMKQIRLEHIALGARAYQPGRFARLMFAFANWMIATGKQLRKRYEIPSAKCNQVASTKRFAH